MKNLNPFQAAPARALLGTVQQAMRRGAAGMGRSACAMWTFEHGRLTAVCPIGALFIGAAGLDVVTSYALTDRCGQRIDAVRAQLQRYYPVLRCTGAGQALARQIGHQARGLAGGRPDLWNLILACADDLSMDATEIADALDLALKQSA